MSQPSSSELGNRIARAAAERAEVFPSAVDPSSLVARGLRQRMLHRLSLAAAGATAVALLVVAVSQAAPQAIRVPDGGFFMPPTSSTEPSQATSPTSTPEPRRTLAPPGPPGPRDTEPHPGIPKEDRCRPSASIPIHGDLEVRLTADETVVARGQDLRLDLSVTNTGSRAVGYEHSGQRYDFWLEDEDGAIWLWSTGKAFQEPLIVDEIAPGEMREASETWTGETHACERDGGSFGPGASGLGRPPPGRYLARALWLTVQGGWWSNPVEIVVV